MSEKAIRNSSELAQEAGKGIALVDFWATWCGPCLMQKPVVEKLADEFAGRATVLTCNVDESQEVAQEFAVFSIPTLVLLRDGEEIERYVGVQSEDRLRKLLDGACETVQA